MKKLKLKALDLADSVILTREQLKNIMGGSGSNSDEKLCGTCKAKGPGSTGTSVACSSPTGSASHCFCPDSGEGACKK